MTVTRTCASAISVSLLALLVAVPQARGQSVSVEAGDLRGHADAGVAQAPPQREACSRGVIVRSGGGGASASASASSSSSDGESVVAGTGSPGSTITTHDCGRDKDRTARRNDHD